MARTADTNPARLDLIALRLAIVISCGSPRGTARLPGTTAFKAFLLELRLLKLCVIAGAMAKNWL